MKLFVLGGDGANWIRSGTEEFGNGVFQLDRFHLSHVCGRGYGRKLSSRIYGSIRAGEAEFARALTSAATEPETDTARRV